MGGSWVLPQVWTSACLCAADFYMATVQSCEQDHHIAWRCVGLGSADITVIKAFWTVEGYDVHARAFMLSFKLNSLQRRISIYRGPLGMLAGLFGMND